MVNASKGLVGEYEQQRTNTAMCTRHMLTLIEWSWNWVSLWGLDVIESKRDYVNALLAPLIL